MEVTATHAHPDFVDTDWPMFRLADAYLMYAEAVLRGGQGGSATEALDYVNDIRRAGLQRQFREHYRRSIDA